MSKIKIGQIGVAHSHGAGKMAVYRQSEDFEVVGVVEPDSALREKAAREPAYRDLKWMSTEELLNTPGLAAVAVETEFDALLDTAETCVGAGMHVHLDKPPGASLSQFKRVLDTAASKHLVLQMGYMYRYNPAVVMMREWLAQGWLGEPFEVHAVMSKVLSPAGRQVQASFPSGMLFELGCHIIDLVVGALGKPDAVQPYAQHVSPVNDGLLDNMLAVFTYPQALATVKSSGVEIEGFARRQFTLCGSEGTFHIQPLDAPNVWMVLSRDRDGYQRGVREIAIGDYPRYVGDALDLAKIIRGEKDTDFSYQHDYHVQETVLKASGLPLDT